MGCSGKGTLVVPFEEWTTFLSDYVPFKSSGGPGFSNVRFETGTGMLVANYVYDESLTGKPEVANASGVVDVADTEWMEWLMKFLPDDIKAYPLRFVTKEPIAFDKENDMLLTFVFASYLSEIDDQTFEQLLKGEA